MKETETVYKTPSVFLLCSKGMNNVSMNMNKNMNNNKGGKKGGGFNRTNSNPYNLMGQY